MQQLATEAIFIHRVDVVQEKKNKSRAITSHVLGVAEVSQKKKLASS